MTKLFSLVAVAVSLLLLSAYADLRRDYTADKQAMIELLKRQQETDTLLVDRLANVNRNLYAMEKNQQAQQSQVKELRQVVEGGR